MWHQCLTSGRREIKTARTVAPDRQFSDVSGEACGAEDVTGDGDFNPGLERQISPNPHSLHTPRDSLEDQVTHSSFLPCNCFVGCWLRQPFKVLQSIWFLVLHDHEALLHLLVFFPSIMGSAVTFGPLSLKPKSELGLPALVFIWTPFSALLWPFLF